MSEATITIPKREYERLRNFQRKQEGEVSKMSAEERYEILKKTGGILRDKLPKDLVAWQRRIRAEWD